MADFSSLKQTIQTYIKQNGNEEITGNILQDVLLAIVSTMGDGAINALASALQEETTARQNQGETLGGSIETLQDSINSINTKLAEGYIYAGIATPSTNPGAIRGKVFYVAVQAGTYTNFSGISVTEGITILKNNGTAWIKELIQGIDNKPMAGSNNLVESGGVLSAIINSSDGVFSKEDFSIHTYNTATGQIDSTSYNRIRLIIPVIKGMKVQAQCSLGSGVDVVIQPSVLETAIKDKDQTTLQTITSDYTTTQVIGSLNYDGFIVVSLKKTDSSNFTNEEREQYVSALSLELNTNFRSSVSFAVPFMSLLLDKGNYFNCNDVTQKIEIPEFACYVNGEYKEFLSQQINYLWNDVATIRYWYALILSDDNTEIKMVEWIKVPESQKKVIAIITRGNLNSNCVNQFYGFDAEYFRINGRAVKGEVDILAGGIKSINDIDYGVIRYNKLLQYLYEKTDGDRLAVGYNVQLGDLIEVESSDENSYFTIEVWDTWTHGVISFGNSPLYLPYMLQCITPDWVPSGSKKAAQITANGVAVIKWKTLSGGAISDSEKAAILSKTRIRLISGAYVAEEGLKSLIDEKDVWSRLEIGSIESSRNGTRVRPVSCIAVPYNGLKIQIKLPVNYKYWVDSGATRALGVTDSGWLRNGDVYTLPYNNIYYAIIFSHEDDTQQLDVNTIKDLLDRGDIEIYYANKDKGGVISRNYDCEKYASAVCKISTTDWQISTDKNLPIFSHISDLHGDIQRAFNFFKFSHYFGVDASFVTGDSVAYQYSDKCRYIEDAIKKYPVKTLMCIGNHEMRNSNVSMTDAFNELIAPYIEQGEYKQTSGVVTTMPYYFVDIDSKKIRIISVDYFIIEPNGGLEYPRLTQEQVNWFISTLSSTPNDYGIIVLLHGQERWITSYTEGYSKFFQKKQLSYPITISLGDGIISKIIDAFISRTIISTNFSEYTINKSETETVTVSADFSNIDSSVEFICFVAGHSHRDRVGYVPNTTNMQLMLDIVCGIALYGTTYPDLANESDLPRGGIGSVQDAFNIYAIDRLNKQVKIARIGANMNFELDVRDYMAIPYKVI